MGKTIILSGMIGVGKTTFAEILSEELNARAYFEEVNNNKLLDKFYQDKKRWGYALQTHFLNNRYQKFKKAVSSDKLSILDRSIFEDKLFALLNYERGNMNEVEFECYLNLLDSFMEELEEKDRKPNLLIHLDAGFETIKERITKRGRDFEQFDENPELLDYIKHLYSKYDNGWLQNNYNQSEVLVIDTEEKNILNDSDKQTIIEDIKEYI